MSILRLIGVEHLPSGINVGNFSNCYGLSLSDFTPSAFWSSDTTTYPNVAHLRVEGNTLQYGGRKESMGTQGAGVASIPMSKLIGSVTPNKLIIGLRLNRLARALSSNGVMYTIPVLAIDQNQFSGGGGGFPVNYFLLYVSADALGSNYYEFVFDFTTGKYDVYKDDVLFSSGTAIPSGLTKASVKNYYWTMGRYDSYIIPAGADQKIFSLSDIYIAADTGTGADSVSRLGPLTVKRLITDSFTGAGWTGTGGAAIPAVLNTRRDSGKLNTPVAIAPVDRTPLRLKVKNSDLAGVPFKAIQVYASAFRDSGTTDNLTASLSYGGTTGTPVAVTPLTNVTSPTDQSLAVSATAPDGTVLDSTNVGSLEIVFTPTA